MGILSWLIFGALAGWIASMIAGTNERQGCILNVIVGVLGAFIGGFIVKLLGGGVVNFGFDLQSFVVAVLGAVILLFAVGAMRRR